MALITCPKCGKEFSDRAKACPQCGTPTNEVEWLIQEQKAKEAEEARIRAEKRAAWWKKNKKLVVAAVIFLFALFLGSMVYVKNFTPITAKNSTELQSALHSPFRFIKAPIKVRIPSGVTIIENNAFYDCDSLTSVTIPNSVTSIGEGAFCGCNSLTSIDIPNRVISIGPRAFWCAGLTSVTIPNSIKSIGAESFRDCFNLTSATIGDGVINIDRNPFELCCSLTSITVENDNTTYDSRDNCNAIIKTATNTLVAGCQSTIIPNSVTSIGECAFCECRGLTSIEIPNGVTNICWNAFSNCTALKSIEIPNSVISIGDYAFYGCSSLTTIEIPNSVTNIEDDVFKGCNCLTVKIPESLRGKINVSDCKEVIYY